MSSEDGDYLGFPGSGASFAGNISQAQGGPSFGVLGEGSDTLPTHPQARNARDKQNLKYSIKYKQFDLSIPSQVSELEDVLSEIANNPLHEIRQERLANDKDGMTIVTISWSEAEVVKRKKKPKKEDGENEGEEDLFPYPTLKDNEHPGTGQEEPLPPRGKSASDVGSEIENSFPDS